MANNSTGSTGLPVLTEREREAIVDRARVELFRLLPGISESDWPYLEMGLQIRINLSPELQRRFWSQPEELIEELMQTPWSKEELGKIFPNEAENYA